MPTVFSEDISRLVLKRSLRADLGGVSLDSQMLQVLMELDGKKSSARWSNLCRCA